MGTLNNKKISTAYARQLAKNYKDRKRVGEDTQAVWFSTTEILAALGLGNLEVPINHPVSGIRFYFGSYGFENEHILEFDTYNKNTLLLVQTGFTEVGGTIQGKPVFQDMFENKEDAAAYPAPATQGSETLEVSEGEEIVGKIFNEAQIGPPPPREDGTINDLLFPAKIV